MKTLGQRKEGDAEGDSTYSHHMKDATFMMPTPRVLANVVAQKLCSRTITKLLMEYLECWKALCKH
jgi:hypothetical protein